MKEIFKTLTSIGFNRDIEVEKEKWMRAKEELELAESILALPTFEPVEEPTFRDDKSFKSVELKDYSHRSDFKADYVAELEHFNPEHHLILHGLVDVPLWWLRNRLLNRGPHP